MHDAASGVLDRVSDRAFFAFTAAVSVTAVAFLGWILVLRDAGPAGATDLRFLPAVNAGLNATAAVLLSTGFVAIRRGARRVHQYCMVAAFVTSTLFLACYVAYHYVHGDTHFGGTGVARAVYLAVLASHVLLSVTVVPLALIALFFAARGEFVRHRRVTRWALPIWLYVSVTGVAIFFMLRGAGS